MLFISKRFLSYLLLTKTLRNIIAHCTPLIILLLSRCQYSLDLFSASVERDQRKILRTATFKKNIPHLPHDYTLFLQVLNLSSLADCRLVNITTLSCPFTFLVLPLIALIIASSSVTWE